MDKQPIGVRTVRTPIFRDTGFHLVDIETIKKAFGQESEYPRNPELYIYSRYRNPNVAAAESMIMELEQSAWSILAQSGLAAIDIALSIFQKNGVKQKWLFFSEIYGGTNHFIDRVLIARRCIDIVRFYPNGDTYNLENLKSLLQDHRPTVVFFEAISNPMLIAVDAEEVIKLSKQFGATVIVDNTFATPYLWRALESGADMVIHSATKYLSGHGTLSAGVISGNNPEHLTECLEYRKLVGHMLSPDDAARLCDFLKSFELRMKKHCENSTILATMLTKHPKVERVLYPGLPNHPTYNESKKLFKGKGFGAIITFDLAGETNEEKANRCNALISELESFIPLIPTLGDADTILMPIEPVWGDKFPFPGMIRLSVGIENTDNLLEILSKALDRIK